MLILLRTTPSTVELSYSRDKRIKIRVIFLSIVSYRIVSELIVSYRNLSYRKVSFRCPTQDWRPGFQFRQPFNFDSQTGFIERGQETVQKMMLKKWPRYKCQINSSFINDLYNQLSEIQLPVILLSRFNNSDQKSYKHLIIKFKFMVSFTTYFLIFFDCRTNISSNGSPYFDRKATPLQNGAQPKLFIVTIKKWRPTQTINWHYYKMAPNHFSDF